jgi:ABC-2 type transport system ATP-binding protein
MKTVAVETSKLTKHFRDFWGRKKVTAVDNLDLQIERGSLFGLLGPNGSGKTTTLNMLTGLLHPSMGHIRVMNGAPRDRTTRKRLGYLPENPGMYPYLSAREMLHFHAGLFGINRRQAEKSATDLLGTVDLSSAADRPVGEFSQGMTRRLGLALSLINDPELLILDEPTAGLDPAGCRLVKNLLRERTAEGKTVIISSHLLSDIEDVCDTVAILQSGQMIVNGTLREMLEQRDQTRFTATGIDDDAQDKLQTAFQSITGAVATIDHPSIKLERFFEQAVKQADTEAAIES